jgi:hypothetical protein
MDQEIVGYHIDSAGDWVAELRCGHFQHVRHRPPWVNRPWVTNEEGRQKMIGSALSCLKCDRGEPLDKVT